MVKMTKIKSRKTMSKPLAHYALSNGWRGVK